MILRTIKGMIPKNKMRLLFLSKVKIYEQGGHDLHRLGLPQFAPVQNVDYNKILGNDYETNKDLYISDSNVAPEQIDEYCIFLFFEFILFIFFKIKKKFFKIKKEYKI